MDNHDGTTGTKITKNIEVMTRYELCGRAGVVILESFLTFSCFVPFVPFVVL